MRFQFINLSPSSPCEPAEFVIAQDRDITQDLIVPRISIETGDEVFILPLDQLAGKLIERVTTCGVPCENNVLRA